MSTQLIHEEERVSDLDILMQQLRADQAEYREFISTGGCRDYPEYTSYTGMILGIEKSIQRLEYLQNPEWADNQPEENWEDQANG